MCPLHCKGINVLMEWYCSKGQKAAGSNAIHGEVLKHVSKNTLDLLLSTFNACLTADVFPSRWKIVRLVLTSKGKLDPMAPYTLPSCLYFVRSTEMFIKSRLTDGIGAETETSTQNNMVLGRSNPQLMDLRMWSQSPLSMSDTPCDATNSFNTAR